VVSGPGAEGHPRRSSRPHRHELPNRTHAHHASRAGTRPRESACEPPRRDPRSGDRSCCSGPGTTSPFPVPHAT